MAAQALRVAVLGVGLMGEDHVKRISQRIKGAEVAVVSDFFEDRAQAVASTLDGARAVKDPFDAINDPDVDAVVITTPGAAHYDQLLACLDRGLPTLCEKPLTLTAAQSLDVVERESRLEAPVIQVGFMRRFDPEYAHAAELIHSGTYGKAKIVNSLVQTERVPETFTTEMVMNDAIIHDMDVARFFYQQEIAQVQAFQPPRSARAHENLADPLFVVFTMEGGELFTVQIYVSSGIGYEVSTRVMCEDASFDFGLAIDQITKTTDKQWGGIIKSDFRDRFGRAYDDEFRHWVAAAKNGTIDGPGSWDGYAANAVCDAGIEAIRTGLPTSVSMQAKRTS